MDLDSSIGVVSQYLMHNPQLPSRMSKQKGAEGMAEFWHPFVDQMRGNVSEDELQIMVQSSLVAAIVRGVGRANLKMILEWEKQTPMEVR